MMYKKATAGAAGHFSHFITSFADGIIIFEYFAYLIMLKYTELYIGGWHRRNIF